MSNPPYPEHDCPACERKEETTTPPHSSIVGSMPVHRPSAQVCMKFANPEMLAALQKGKRMREEAIHRVTSNYDLVDNPISLRSDCGTELAFPRRIPTDRLILGQRIPSFTTKSETDTACYFCSNAGPLRDKGIWESYWQQAEPRAN